MIRQKHETKKRKAQALLEFIVLLAAFFSLLTAFASFAAQARKNAENVFAESSLKQEAESLCFLIDYFALDGRNTVLSLDLVQAGFENASVSGDGRVLTVSENKKFASATCHSKIRSLETLEIEQSEFEPV